MGICFADFEFYEKFAMNVFPSIRFNFVLPCIRREKLIISKYICDIFESFLTSLSLKRPILSECMSVESSQKDAKLGLLRITYWVHLVYNCNLLYLFGINDSPSKSHERIAHIRQTVATHNSWRSRIFLYNRIRSNFNTYWLCKLVSLRSESAAFNPTVYSNKQNS